MDADADTTICPVCKKKGDLLRVEELGAEVCKDCAIDYKAAWEHKDIVDNLVSIIDKYHRGILTPRDVLRKIILKLDEGELL